MSRASAAAVGVIVTMLLAAFSAAWAAPDDVHAAAQARTASAAVAKTKKKRVYCKSNGRPRGCVKIPPSVLPSGGSDQQGTGVIPAAETGGGRGGGPGDHAPAAVAWANGERGKTNWAWYCERFVEEAYGTRDRYDTAVDAAKSLPLDRGSIKDAPPGALVYFAGDKTNQGWGHVGISLGNGRMVSALATVTKTNVLASRYWRGLYVGWTPAPKDWPGQIPPPPGPTTPTANVTVTVTSPSVGSVQSGSVKLIASAKGTNRVDFEAFYATDQRDPASRGWHPLGTGKLVDGNWELDWNTAGIPDQGFGDWGTVNIAAIAIDAKGRRTGTRDYRRISIDNTTGSSPPLPAPQPSDPGTPPTYAETTGGYARTWSNYRNAGGTEGQGIPGFTTVRVSCKVQGYQVPDGNTWWYRLVDPPWSGQFYVTADAFFNNGQTSGSLTGTPFVDVAVPLCP